MYPETPQSVAGLVPLPQGNGPKIKAFDFQGPQQIEFLDRLGSGIHSIVFRVKIRGQIYALKLASIPLHTKIEYNQRLTSSSSGSRATKAGSHQRTRTTGMIRTHLEPSTLILSLLLANAMHLANFKRPVTKNWHLNVSAIFIFCWTMHTKEP